MAYVQSDKTTDRYMICLPEFLAMAGCDGVERVEVYACRKHAHIASFCCESGACAVRLNEKLGRRQCMDEPTVEQAGRSRLQRDQQEERARSDG